MKSIRRIFIDLVLYFALVHLNIGFLYACILRHQGSPRATSLSGTLVTIDIHYFLEGTIYASFLLKSKYGS